MEKQLITRLTKNFEDYSHQEDGIEFWFARDLQILLGYDKWVIVQYSEVGVAS